MKLKGLINRAQKAASWLGSRFINSALVLGYHRVADVSHDPFDICITPQHFAEHLEVLRRYAHPVGLQELMQRLINGNLPPGAVALTIDDGYADNLYHAKPLLEHYQIPATIFVATGNLGREFWWDELERMLMSPEKLPEQLSLTLKDVTYEWALSNDDHEVLQKETPWSRERLLWSVYQLFLPLTPAELEIAMDQLRSWVGLESYGVPSSRAVTADELFSLSTDELIEIGAHTVSHPVLTELPKEAQEMEICGSKAFLEDLLGQPVISFAYPNGAYNEETKTIVREAGFLSACASSHGVVWQGSNPFSLPRLWISDLDRVAFLRLLKWWSLGRMHRVNA
ncbi:MAG: polysaccharide deacetylase family protein [Anaerolineales bacterium]|jgi:peptidoglycan/xylan/chitin deacetylase (PgdA/CDA1 family)